MIALICACDIVPFWGIAPERIAARILDLLANTSACVVKGPPELALPAAWQLLFIEQTVVRIGCTSATNFGLIPAQEKVIPPLPPPPGAGSLLLHDIINKVVKKKRRMFANVIFIA
jgi:hypothetical protein